MALEIEKKYRISDEVRTRIRAELKRQGAVRIGEEFESNAIYSGGSLTGTGGVVRIRTTDSRSLLTFKRRVPSDSEMKVQIEHETEISDPNSTADLLHELGLRAGLVYEKRRETWKFGDVEVVVDELPFGLFVEIEGDEHAIVLVEKQLGLTAADVEPETYPRLTARLGVKVGSVIEARFAG